jgi:hypothetical protein
MFILCKRSAGQNAAISLLSWRTQLMPWQTQLMAHAVLWCVPLGWCATAGAQGLTLHYQERAPYSTALSDGTVAGLTATPAAQALQQAGLRFAWVRTPSQRQLALIQEGDGLHCGLGWLRNAERSAKGKFSQALYRDRPFGALARWHAATVLCFPA